MITCSNCVVECIPFFLSLDSKLDPVGYKECIFIITFLFYSMIIYKSPAVKKKKIG